MAARLAYFDSSALAKRYCDEEGAVQARRLLRQHRVVAAAFASLEVMSALRRRRAAAEISQEEFDSVFARLRSDREHWHLVEVTSSVIERAEELMLAAPLRTLDALHLACATIFQSQTGVRLRFITGDARQRDAARRTALDIVWLGARAA